MGDNEKEKMENAAEESASETDPLQQYLDYFELYYELSPLESGSGERSID